MFSKQLRVCLPCHVFSKAYTNNDIVRSGFVNMRTSYEAGQGHIAQQLFSCFRCIKYSDPRDVNQRHTCSF